MTKLTPHVRAILNKPVFEGHGMTLKTVLNAFAALANENTHPRDIQHLTGLSEEECKDIALAGAKVLSLTEI
jgi:hypothetical protein